MLNDTEDREETVEALRADRDRWRALALETISNMAMARGDFEAIFQRAIEHRDEVNAETMYREDC